jgi:hypothetical protein
VSADTARVGVLPTVYATRVVRRERSGSSSPVVVESSTGPWFTKLRGAAQGVAPLVAELIVAELAEALSLAVPSRALIELPPDVSSDDVNDELRDLLNRSSGLNIGFQVLEAARNLTRVEFDRVPLDVAASVLWLDMLVQNLDRTPANPNMMVRRGTYWLIDHGAALSFHHDWGAVHEYSARQPYDVPGHVFGWAAPVLAVAHESLGVRATRALFNHAVSVVPDELLAGAGVDVPRRRAAYAAWLWKRRQWMDDQFGAGSPDV